MKRLSVGISPKVYHEVDNLRREDREGLPDGLFVLQVLDVVVQNSSGEREEAREDGTSRHKTFSVEFHVPEHSARESVEIVSKEIQARNNAPTSVRNVSYYSFRFTGIEEHVVGEIPL
jgi:hypothetical protein